MRSCRYLGVLVSSCALVLVGGASAAFATAPTVTSISPNSGPAAGGKSVTIKGTGFITGSTVKVGENSATGITVVSSTTITATTPAGSTSGYGVVDVKVTNTNGTSAAVAEDQYGYDAPAVGPWLGLNGNSAGAYLGAVGDFTAHDIVYDRGGSWHGSAEAGMDWGAGELPTSEDGLSKSIAAGMIPIITIENTNAKGLPRTTAEIEEYVSGFVTSAKAIRSMYPGKQILFEPINEPWEVANKNGEIGFAAKQYAAIIAALLPECEAKGIPLQNVYVAAAGEEWLPKMYGAQSALKKEVQGWYFHPYGPPHGTEHNNDNGIESVPAVQSELTSGQNNIIISEFGYWTPDVNTVEEEKNGYLHKGGPESAWAANSTQAAQWLGEALKVASVYRQEGWLKALVVFSRNAGGWAMEVEPSVLTKQGEALDPFGNFYGLNWLAQPTPSPGGGDYTLKGISCVSTTACEAVGSGENSLAEAWNGTAWSLQTVPHLSENLSSELIGVSCTSANACTAAGSTHYTGNIRRILIERWNGGEWSIQSTPSTQGELRGVSCLTSTSCTVAGWSTSAGKNMTLVMVWNGTTWSTQTTPNPAGSTSQWLESVSCTSTTACTAVGYYEISSHEILPMAERWNGTEWSLQTMVTPTGSTTTGLKGVSCVSSTYCIAAGVQKVGTHNTPLAEVWNGTSWALQTVPLPPETSAALLTGLSCVSSTSCTAVGQNEHTVVEHWNGTEWFVQSSPNPVAGDNLLAVSCLAPLECRAVGVMNGGAHNQTLVESSL